VKGEPNRIEDIPDTEISVSVSKIVAALIERDELKVRVADLDPKAKIAGLESSLAVWREHREHEDTAPHEGCGCKLCSALHELNELRGGTA